MKPLVCVFIAIANISLLIGCSDPTKTFTEKNGKTVTIAVTQEKQDQLIKNYGNGLYYFGYNGDDFGLNLSLFIAQHKELELVSMAPDDKNGGGSTDGYFVKFRPINPCPRDTTVEKGHSCLDDPGFYPDFFYPQCLHNTAPRTLTVG